ncbi:MAG: GTP-binding protein HflX, partial [Enterovirga sp.]|nr:GTP-binding protein HflX [Enterovirga sp.]
MEARLDEAVGLARAIELHIVDQFFLTISPPRPATLLGSGKVEEIAGRIAAEEINLVV